MTHFPCDDDPDEIRTDWLATIREAKAVAARPGTPRSTQRALAKQLRTAARKSAPVSSSTLYAAAREIEGK